MSRIVFVIIMLLAIIGAVPIVTVTFHILPAIEPRYFLTLYVVGAWGSLALALALYFREQHQYMLYRRLYEGSSLDQADLRDAHDGLLTIIKQLMARRDSELLLVACTQLREVLSRKDRGPDQKP